MFTGIIATTARLKEFQLHSSGGAVLTCVGDKLPALSLGESIAVNGCCLTLTNLQDTEMSFDISRETLNKTNFAGQKKDSKLNLEFPMKLADGFGGHIVTGHVDGIAIVESVEKHGSDWTVWVRSENRNLQKYCVAKGSLTLNGVSLTISEIQSTPAHETFRLDLIPETLQRTNLEAIQVGTRLNLEVDILAKHLEKLIKNS